MNIRPAAWAQTLSITAFFFILGTMVLGPIALAGVKALNAEDAEALVTGNTLAGFVPKDQTRFTTFYSHGGKVYSLTISRNGKRTRVIGRWWINQDGKLCTDWKSYDYVDACHGLGLDDETVTFIDESGRIVSFAELRTGNSEGL